MELVRFDFNRTTTSMDESGRREFLPPSSVILSTSDCFQQRNKDGRWYPHTCPEVDVKCELELPLKVSSMTPDRFGLIFNKRLELAKNTSSRSQSTQVDAPLLPK